MVAVRMCVSVVAAAVTVVARSVTDGHVPRAGRYRPAVEHDVYVSVADVPATARHLRTYNTPACIT